MTHLEHQNREVLDRLTRPQAADYLGLKAQTLALWATSGRYSLPYIKVGGRVYYRKADLDAWMATRTITHTGQLAD